MRWIGLPRNSIEPFWGSRMPEMVLRTMVLPAPLAPSSVTIWPRHLKADAPDGLNRSVIALDIAELENDVGSAHAIVLMRRDRRRRHRDGAAPRKASPSRSR